MRFSVFALGPLQTNCFVLDTGGQAIVVDPGGDPSPVLAFLKNEGLTLALILNTHFHLDHILGNQALAKATGSPIKANPEDAFLLETELGGGGFMGLPMVPAFEYEPFTPGETTLLGQPCRILSTPGHTPGSLSFYFPDARLVLVGDLIFKRSIGRTDFPGGSMDALLNSVREAIFTLPDQTVILSGHGPQTSVHDEKRHNPFCSDYQP